MLTTSLAMLAAQQLSTEESEAGCKASRTRNIHDHYRIIEKPIGSGGFGVVSSSQPQFNELGRC